MKRFLFIATILLSGIISVQAQKKEEKKIIVEKIVQNDKKLKIFWEKSMIDSIIDLYTTNCYYLPEYGDIMETREAVAKTIKSEFKSGLKVLQFTQIPAEHKVYDDLVIEIGVRILKYITKANPAPVTEKYNYQIIWKKTSGGEYKIRSEMWNLIKK